MAIIETTYFYYREPLKPRDTKRNLSLVLGPPRVTLCRVQDDQHRFGVGWAICTEPTPHHKDLWHVLYHEGVEIPGNRVLVRGGRSIARGRAEAALRDHDRQEGRGRFCTTYSDVELYRFNRPIVDQRALSVIDLCHARDLLKFVAASDILFLPDPFRDFSPPKFLPREREDVYNEELETFVPRRAC